jgi:hypothetical protein
VILCCRYNRVQSYISSMRTHAAEARQPSLIPPIIEASA